jgi:ABC-2 type transport system ATP-binding protein
MIAEEISNIASVSAPRLVLVRNLVKRFGSLTAVNDISFEIKEGEIFGFLGPNGAGKSTTIKMICTLLVPTAGSITVAGSDVLTQADSVRSRIGIVFQDNSLDSGLTALENLHFHCMMYHIPRQERAHRIDEVLRMVDLMEHQRRIVKTYSGGMRRRLEIARGLLHRPNLLVLDEPTVGLDPQTRRYIWSYIHQLRQEHRMAIFMTTHYMDEAENCNRIAILDKGVIVALDTPTALKKLVGDDQVELGTHSNSGALEVLRNKYNIQATERDGKVMFEVEDAEHFVPRLLAEFSQPPNGLVVESLHIRRPTLEDVFLKLTGRLIREEEGEKDERRLNMRQRGRI